MPFTVITLKNVPNSLRGELTRWMQEIATGVYVGSYNSKVREYLWKRVSESVDAGEATISYSCRNEIGYSFSTRNTERHVVDFDGIPLVLIPSGKQSEKTVKIKKSTSGEVLKNNQSIYQTLSNEPLKKVNIVSSNVSGRSLKQKNSDIVFIDIETTGLNAETDQIIEVGAIKISSGKEYQFHHLVRIDTQIPEVVRNLTKITDEMLSSGTELEIVISDFQKFIKDSVLVGYNISFDLKFLNKAFGKFSLDLIHNNTQDLMSEAKKRNTFQANYRFETTLKTYGINQSVPHRALDDAKLLHLLYNHMFHINC
jgi:CRISPR-associated protein Cas2